MLATLADETRLRRQRLSWTHTEELLAQLLEHFSALRREFLINKGVPTSDAPDVWRYPRPGEKPREKEKRTVTAGQMAKMLMKG